MRMNTVRGALTLDEALAQLREHYTEKLAHAMTSPDCTIRPDWNRARGALDALDAIEWHVQEGD